MNAVALVVALVAIATGHLSLNPSAPPVPTPSAYSAPSALPTFDESILQGTDLQRQLLSRDKAQVSDALRKVVDRDFPFLAPPTATPGSTATLVLSGRPEPYDLAVLAPEFPDALEFQIDGSLLVKLPILVGRGATLIVNRSTTPALHLLSSPGAYAHITAVEATLHFIGGPVLPLTVTSRNTATDAPDDELTDGRAYIRATGSRMDFAHTQVSRLGFLLGESSGVAWMTRTAAPSTGGARDSTFTANYFGAYSSGAIGLIISRSQFNDNLVYGFDPHTRTINTVVESSVAARNGRHGFIFSDDCHDNVIRDSQAYLNGGAGFMIDDGRDNGEAEPLASNRNTLERISAHDNGGPGIVIEGGSANSVRQAQVDNSPVGIWVKNAASDTTVIDTSITNTAQAGLRLNPGTVATSMTNSSIAAGAIGVAIDGALATRLTDVTIADATVAGITLARGSEELVLDRVQIVGSGRGTITGGDPSISRDSPPGLDTSGWTSSQAKPSRWWDSVSMVKLAPWVIILGIPALLWLPIRARWRRRHPPPFSA